MGIKEIFAIFQQNLLVEVIKPLKKMLDLQHFLGPMEY
jgi:hypothetical protein